MTTGTTTTAQGPADEKAEGSAQAAADATESTQATDSQEASCRGHNDRPIRAPKNCESKEKSRFMARKRARLFVSIPLFVLLRATKIQWLQLVWLHDNALCRFTTWWTRGYATGFFLSTRPSRSSASSSS